MIEKFEINPSQNRPEQVSQKEKKFRDEEAVFTLRKQVEVGKNNLNKLVEWFEKDKNAVINNKDQKVAVDNPGRRALLKNAGKTVLGLAVSGGVLGAIGEFSKKYGNGRKDYGVGLSDWEMGQELGKNKKILAQEEATEIWKDEQKYIKALKDNEEKVRREAEEMRRKIIESDTRTIREIFLAQNKEGGRIEISRDVDTVIENSWHKQYSKGEKLHSSLISALDIMKPWYLIIKDQFINIARQEGINIPLELVYLAIPESHCRIDKPSPAGAHGWYQLTEIAARELNRVAVLKRDKERFIVDNNFDERYDPVKCSRMAAKLLCLWYKEFKRSPNSEKDTWDLVLARYNGSYVNDFKKEVDGKSSSHAGCRQEAITYQAYLDYRECRINTFIDDVEKNGYYIDENKKTKVIVELEDDGNGNKRISEKSFKKLLNEYLSSSLENFNYPPKLRGVLRIMDEENLALSKNNLTEYPDRIEGYYNKSLRYIAKKEGLSLFALKNANPHILNLSAVIPGSVNIYHPTVIKIKVDKVKIKHLAARRKKIKDKKL